MSETPPEKLGRAVLPKGGKEREHVLIEEVKRTAFFASDPFADPRKSFPDVRWVQLRGAPPNRPVPSKALWVAYAEINALADYLPNPYWIDALGPEVMVPVLQRMRESIMEKTTHAIGTIPGWGGDEAYRRAGLAEVPRSFLGAAKDPWVARHLDAAAGEVEGLDAATSGLGWQRYKGLLSRNACHFAPYSWERWRNHHNTAREEARAHHAERGGGTPKGSVGLDMGEHGRRAFLNNGYAEHFLQDSFAAGHLINKTLVMQWFVQYIRDTTEEHIEAMRDKGYKVPGPPYRYGPERIISPEIFQVIPGQKGIGARGLYDKRSSTVTTTHDASSRTAVTDPQTAQERWGREGRIAGSGVTAGAHRTKEENYQTYLDFLNNTYISLAANAVHDWLNDRGMTVINGRGDRLAIGGDGTLVSHSDPAAIAAPAKASQLNQQAIDELMKSGATAITPERIFEFVPVTVFATPTVEGAMRKTEIDLGSWQENVLHDLCVKAIFPGIVRGHNDLAALYEPQLVGAGMSRDSP